MMHVLVIYILSKLIGKNEMQTLEMQLETVTNVGT